MTSFIVDVEQAVVLVVIVVVVVVVVLVVVVAVVVVVFVVVVEVAVTIMNAIGQAAVIAVSIVVAGRRHCRRNHYYQCHPYSLAVAITIAIDTSTIAANILPSQLLYHHNCHQYCHQYWSTA